MKKGITFALCSILSGTVGGIVVWILQGHTLAIWPSDISYPDLIAVLLTGVSLVVAIIGVAVAFLALWGFAQFRNVVRKKTLEVVEKITPSHLVEELRSENSKKILRDIVADFVESDGFNLGAAQAWAKEREKQQAKLREVDAEDQ